MKLDAALAASNTEIKRAWNETYRLGPVDRSSVVAVHYAIHDDWQPVMREERRKPIGERFPVQPIPRRRSTDRERRRKQSYPRFGGRRMGDQERRTTAFGITFLYWGGRRHDDPKDRRSGKERRVRIQRRGCPVCNGRRSGTDRRKNANR